ncbi:acyl-CoA dehydrogenase family protein [Mycobacterium colombiense]
MTMLTDDDATELLALRELADDIFGASTESVLDVPAVGLAYDPGLWSTLAESGLTLLTTPEPRGGSGAGLRELSVVLQSSGYHAAPVPIAEHDLLASWLLGMVDLPLATGAMTAGITDQPLRGGRLTATLDHVPWANVAEAIIVAGDGFVAKVPRQKASVEAHADIAGQPSGRVHLDVLLEAGEFRATDVTLAPEFRLRGALARALQTCGALARALDLTRDHAQQREQFGRPIAKFQGVQALIANAAGAVSLATTAAQFAAVAASVNGFHSSHARFAVAVAKIESARAATLVARNAHQVHGAIGFTLDHRLRHFTTRALAWRSEFGTQRQWQHHLGTMALDSPSTVWELVTQLSSSVGDSQLNNT